MFAPAEEVTFGFIEKRMFDFYEDVFVSMDAIGAHERQLAPNLQQFHCVRLVLKSLIGYMRDHCTGKGRRKRVQTLLNKNLGPGKQHPNTLELRRVARQVARVATEPSQALVDRHAKPFLMGQTLPMSFDEVLAFVRADALRYNVLVRRAARSKQRNRRIRHAGRKRLRSLERRKSSGVLR
jgi:hypothetical protein